MMSLVLVCGNQQIILVIMSCWMMTIVNLPGEGAQYRIGRSNRCLSLLPCSVRMLRSDLFHFVLLALYIFFCLVSLICEGWVWQADFSTHFSGVSHLLIISSSGEAVYLQLQLILSRTTSLLCECQVPHLPCSGVFPGSSLLLLGKSLQFLLGAVFIFGKELFWSLSALWV